MKYSSIKNFFASARFREWLPFLSVVALPAALHYALIRNGHRGLAYLIQDLTTRLFNTLLSEPLLILFMVVAILCFVVAMAPVPDEFDSDPRGGRSMRMAQKHADQRQRDSIRMAQEHVDQRQRDLEEGVRAAILSQK